MFRIGIWHISFGDMEPKMENVLILGHLENAKFFRFVICKSHFSKEQKDNFLRGTSTFMSMLNFKLHAIWVQVAFKEH